MTKIRAFTLIYICICLYCVSAKIEVDESLTGIINTRQGPIQGKIVRKSCCKQVEVFLGIPYASPPGRFMPPSSPPKWEDVFVADSIKPVCPQFLPDLSDNRIPTERKKIIEKMMPYLRNESENCLYLNVYVPHTNKGDRSYEKPYPVLMFIHGESFEWNSGNLYEGTVLASVGDIIFVSINFRLGIFGFLKSDLSVRASNFGLLDQMAALRWIKENIADFGGDPNRITVMGHGTGAACAHFLMLSPLSPGLFHRVIMMSGSALSSWSLTTSELTYMEVAHQLSCPVEDIKNCSNKRTDQKIKEAVRNVYTTPFKNAFTPVVDNIVVLNAGTDHLRVYRDLFQKYDLLAGVTEVESYYLLQDDQLLYGLNYNDARKILESYTSYQYEKFPVTALTKTLEKYISVLKSPSLTDHRNAVLDALSDALVAAPLMQTVKYHVTKDKSTFFYVFGHHTHSKRAKVAQSVVGDELPYILGIPVGGSSYHYDNKYNYKEQELSMDMMRYWSNFVKTGDPNTPRIDSSLPIWPRFRLEQQYYLLLDVHSQTGLYYRKPYELFWNSLLPAALSNCSRHLGCLEVETSSMSELFEDDAQEHSKISSLFPDDIYINFNKSTDIPLIPETSEPKSDVDTTVDNASASFSSLFMLLLTIGICFTLLNLCIFAVIHGRRKKRDDLHVGCLNANALSGGERYISGTYGKDCYIKSIHETNTLPFAKKASSEKDSVTNNAQKVASVKPEAISGKRMRRWPLSRQCSGSTITMDPHTKVCEWITQEIVRKCSPKFLRKSKKEDYSAIPVRKNLEKRDKVSIGIDATPAARTGSVLKQIPIELTKSLDGGKNPAGFNQMRNSSSLSSLVKKPPLQRSYAVSSEDCDSSKNTLHKTSATIRLKTPAIVREELSIHHSHSRSDPVTGNFQPVYMKQEPLYSKVDKSKKCLKSFSSGSKDFSVANSVESSSHYEDINVTSSDMYNEPILEDQPVVSIKKRHFPKVLPDFPDNEENRKLKRLSLPYPNVDIYSYMQNAPGKYCKRGIRTPPAPPARLTPSTERNDEKQLSHLTVHLKRFNKSEKLHCDDEYSSDTSKSMLDDRNQRTEPRIIIKPSVGSNYASMKRSQIPRVVHPSHAFRQNGGGSTSNIPKSVLSNDNNV